MEPASSTQQEIDIDSIAGIVQRFFVAVSFEEGDLPSYAAIPDLFLAEGKLIRNSGPAPEITTVTQFIDARQAMVDAGVLRFFHESEVSATTDVFGNIAHRLSVYEKRGYSGETSLDGRGVVSTQFVRTPMGWKISSMAWDDERPG